MFAHRTCMISSAVDNGFGLVRRQRCASLNENQRQVNYNVIAVEVL